MIRLEELLAHRLERDVRLAALISRTGMGGRKGCVVIRRSLTKRGSQISTEPRRVVGHFAPVAASLPRQVEA